MSSVFAQKPLPYRCTENLSLIHLGEQRVFLNESGTAIWKLLDGKRDNGEVARALVAEAKETPAGANLPEMETRVNRYANALYQLRLLNKVNGDSVTDVDLERPKPETGGADPTEKPKVTPGQDRCVTARKQKGAFSVRAGSEQSEKSERPEKSGAAATVEERFEELYWEKYYIQKMHVELTYRCNFRCIQCYNTTHAGTDTELTLEQWVSVLQQLADNGCHTLTFTGGEVFVRKDAIEILRAASQRGFAIRVNTNGSLINENMIQQMEPMRPFLQGFDISFYGATPIVHDTLARRIGGYQATLRAVRLLSEAKMNLVAKFITMKDNVEGVEQWQNDMTDLGVKHSIGMAPLIPQTNRNASPMVQILTDEQYKKLMQLYPSDEGQGAHFCRPGCIRGAITPDGYVSPCEWLTDFKFGNLKERSLHEIWHSQESTAFRKIFDEEESECPSCELRPGCSRCPARSYLETGHLQQCAPTPRHYAEVHKEMQAAHNEAETMH